MVNIIRNKRTDQNLRRDDLRDTENGRISSNAISRSNMRNRIATRKNRNENGRRGDFIGSKPHSYGASLPR